MELGPGLQGLFEKLTEGFQAHGLKYSEIDKKANPADYQIHRQRNVKRQ